MFDMPDVITPLLFAFLVSVSLAIGFCWNSTSKTGTINELRREAVERGFAEWKVIQDRETVTTEFVWRDGKKSEGSER